MELRAALVRSRQYRIYLTMPLRGHVAYYGLPSNMHSPESFTRQPYELDANCLFQLCDPVDRFLEAVVAE